MPQEIELKLSLPYDCHEQLIEHPLLKTVKSQQRALLNLYFDTPNQQLNQHKIALRIRQIGSRFIQTLKTRGHSQGGLHQRQEWEFDIDKSNLDFDKLPTKAFPADIDPKQLRPAFKTDFERTSWDLQLPAKSNAFEVPNASGVPCELELVLDNGWVSEASINKSPSNADNTDQRQDRISEIELELKQGNPSCLFSVALTLAQSIPLRITQISKAERGYRLMDPQRARQAIKSQQTDPNASPVIQFAQQLESFQALIEAYEFLDDPRLLPQIVDCFAKLTGQCQQLEFAVPKTTLEVLAHSLSNLTEYAQPWQSSTAMPDATEENLKQCQDNIKQLLVSQPFNYHLLKLSHIVYQLTTHTKQ